MNQDNIMVSIVYITYNHEKYISQALEGFLNQKTTFPIEIIIHDDASTDRTPDIIINYASRYPTLITPILQNENQYSQGKIITEKLIMQAKGKYIAFCEGDDYWTDPNKLQEQVDILERNIDLVASTHNEIVVRENGTPWPKSYQISYREHHNRILDRKMLNYKCKFAHTASIVVRRDIFTGLDGEAWEAYKNVRANGDMKWAALMASQGNVYHIAKDMACYRYVPNGTDSWSSRTHDKNITLSTYQQLQAIRTFTNQYLNFDPSYEEFVKNLNFHAFGIAIKRPSKENISIMIELKKKSSYRFKDFLLAGAERIKKKLLK